MNAKVSIICPACQASYAVSAASLGDKGRRVKCVKCQNTWFQDPPLPPETAEPATDFAAMMAAAEAAGKAAPPEPPAKKDTAPKKDTPATPKRVGSQAGMMVLAGVVFVLAAMLGLRDMVVAVVPQMARYYLALGLGLEPPGLGLKVDGLTARLEKLADGQGKLLVSGVIHNDTKEAIAVPPLLITLLEGSNTLKSWSLPPLRAELAAGEKIDFTEHFDGLAIAVPAPGEPTGKNIAVSFTHALYPAASQEIVAPTVEPVSHIGDAPQHEAAEPAHGEEKPADVEHQGEEKEGAADKGHQALEGEAAAGAAHEAAAPDHAPDHGEHGDHDTQHAPKQHGDAHE